jgi:hypothetical protein
MDKPTTQKWTRSRVISLLLSDLIEIGFTRRGKELVLRNDEVWVTVSVDVSPHVGDISKSEIYILFLAQLQASPIKDKRQWPAAMSLQFITAELKDDHAAPIKKYLLDNAGIYENTELARDTSLFAKPFFASISTVDGYIKFLLRENNPNRTIGESVEAGGTDVDLLCLALRICDALDKIEEAKRAAQLLSDLISGKLRSHGDVVQRTVNVQPDVTNLIKKYTVDTKEKL